MTRRRLLILAAAAVLVAGSIFAWRATRKPAGVRYDTAQADRGPLTAKVTASGTLSAVVTVQVGSQVSGRLAEVLVDYNSSVKKGQLIARIDPQLFEAAVEQARANLAAAQGNLEKAKAQAVDADRVAQRTAALAEQKLVALADRDTAVSNADAARAGVAAAKGQVQQNAAALHQAEVNLAYTRIVSPTNGTVISRNVDVGQTVAASLQAPTLFVIAEDLARMQVDTNVAEADVGKLRDGMAATFTVDAFAGEKFEGVVRQIRYAAQTVQNVVTYDAVIDVQNPQLKLRPGMTANVTFVYAERDDALRVPNAALRFRPAPEVLAAIRAESGAAPAGDGGGRRRGGAAAPAPGAQVNADGAPGSASSQPGAGGPPAGGRDAGRANGNAGNGRTAVNGTGAAGPGGREEPGRRTLWVLRGGKPVELRIRTGISDGTMTEVIQGDLQPGDACVVDASGGAGGRPAGATGGRGPRLL
ncbi:efflux RND transporter periplasmic adaptor subunit [Anaeromyxobacter oryzae]|uniref:Efflux RND transporter periplasmic adaptor subunit n=1 Tax=Anaeromyxobacter oryzae TaxID=2918170 RepID=A0ABM7WNU7_9BACT|nr:efflux RND transporter periplasmic adaptor subunit [Anaeromyxobacter oryzae]BDG01143.1 hypothetical protein AMOR_01390 [Anaeromyxobacter oryzae]